MKAIPSTFAIPYEWTTSANPSLQAMPIRQRASKVCRSRRKADQQRDHQRGLMPYNDKYAPPGGDLLRMVEVYNNGSEAVSLKGWG